MGNTKQIYFSGRIKNEDTENPFFKQDIEKQLLEVAHGDHAVVRVEKEGYLYLDEGDSFVIGALTTHSMSGFNVLDFLKTHLLDFSIIGRDADWSDIQVWVSDENNEVVKIIYDPKT